MALKARIWGEPFDPWGSPDRAWGLIHGTLETLAPKYHMQLGGVGLMQARGGYQRSAAQQLAAQFSIGGLTNHDRITDQGVIYSQWDGGEGFRVHETSNPDRYNEGAGLDPFTIEGAISLGPYLSAVAAVTSLAVNAVTCMIVFKGLLILGLSNGKVYQFDGTTLTLNYDTTKTSGIASFMIWEDNLYVGTNDTDGVVYRWVYVSATTTWATNYTVGDLAGDSVTAVPGHSPHIQEGVLNAYYGASESIHALVGQIANTGGTTVAANALKLFEPKLGLLIAYNGHLIAIGNDTTSNFWRLYDGDDSNTIGWTSKAPIFGGYITAGAVLVRSDNGDEKLFLGDSKGQIWSYDGSRIALEHSLNSDAVPYTVSILGMAAWRGGLWVSILHTDGTCGLLRFDGKDGWSRPVYGMLGTTPGPICVFNDRLYVATNATGAARLYKADGTFGSGGYVQQGLTDADLPDTLKKWQTVDLRHSALVSGQSVTVQYRLDGGAWVTLGSSSTVGATTAQLTFSNDVQSTTIEIKTTLAGSAGSSSNLTVYGVGVSYRPAPPPKREWQLTVRLEGPEATVSSSKLLVLVDGSNDTRSGEEISDQIWALVDDNIPVTFLDKDRSQLAVVNILEYSEADAGLPNPDDKNMKTGWDLQGKLRLQEV